MADGRLDEAYQLIQSDGVRDHRRGQTLVTELVSKLVQRGKLHLAGGRSVEALADCDKAQQLGGNLEPVLALRNEIEQTVVENDRARRQQVRAGAVETAAALVDSALGRQDMDRAVAELVRARGNGCSDQRLRELDGQVRTSLQSQIETSLNEGRLDKVDPLMDRLVRLDPEGITSQQLQRAFDQARKAWEAIERGRPQEAEEILHRLAVQLPSAKWIEEVLTHLEAAGESLRAVRTGPMGLLTMNERPSRDTGVSPVPSPQHGRDARVTGDELPAKLLVQVDGAGSYLVLRKPSVTLGPISSSRAPDIGLITEPGAFVLAIERVEDDYFLKGEGTASKLLAAGDRISVSSRCRMIFGLPNPSSTSAVLDLSAGRFPRSDLRRVILLDRDLIIGPGASAHIRANQLSESIVLHIRDGRLWCRTQQVQVGTPLSVAGVSFVVTKG